MRLSGGVSWWRRGRTITCRPNGAISRALCGADMSTAHRGEPKSEAELNRRLGEGDTPELAARPVKLNASCGIGYGAGVSVDGKTVYIDHQLYDELCGGKIALPQGLDPVEILRAWTDHEHIEWAIDAG